MYRNSGVVWARHPELCLRTSPGALLNEARVKALQIRSKLLQRDGEGEKTKRVLKSDLRMLKNHQRVQMQRSFVFSVREE